MGEERGKIGGQKKLERLKKKPNGQSANVMKEKKMQSKYKVVIQKKVAVIIEFNCKF